MAFEAARKPDEHGVVSESRCYRKRDSRFVDALLRLITIDCMKAAVD